MNVTFYYHSQRERERVRSVFILVIDVHMFPVFFVDVYLTGTVMLIFGMGLYGLFITNIPCDLPPKEDRALRNSSLFGMFLLRVKKNSPTFLSLCLVYTLFRPLFALGLLFFLEKPYFQRPQLLYPFGKYNLQSGKKWGVLGFKSISKCVLCFFLKSRIFKDRNFFNHSGKRTYNLVKDGVCLALNPFPSVCCSSLLL